MACLQNEHLICDFNGQGQIVRMVDRKTQNFNIISRPVDLFKIVLHRDENWEDVAFQNRQLVQVIQEENMVRIIVPQLRTHMGAINISVEASISLTDTVLTFDAEIKNHSQATVTDFSYPCIGGITSLGGERMDLIWPDRGGVKYINICEHLQDVQDNEEPRYIREAYPWPLSLGWSMLVDGDHCLYCGTHDPLLHATALCAQGSREGDVTLKIDKMAFVAPEVEWKAPQGIVSLYEGSWREGADIYGEWARTWWKKEPCPQWVQDMTGYFLTIQRQQYGDELWPYDTLPRLWELAKQHGMDTLGLFGWYSTGHDNRYPQIEPADNWGGEAALKENIRKIQEDGARVTMYQNGHLIDMSSDFYQEHQEKTLTMTRWGQPYQDQYSKFHNSEYLRYFSKKTFGVACPSYEPLQEKMTETMSTMRGYGADGILIDQIGGISPFPCFSNKHEHKYSKPSLTYAHGRYAMLKHIRKQDKELPGFAVMTETITDAYSSYFDMLHSFGSWPGKEGERIGLSDPKTKPRMIMWPEVYNYIFPESVITCRNPKPYIDPRMVGYCFAFGFRYELELRYLADLQWISEDRRPDWRLHARAASELRRKYGDFLLRGRYRADEGIACADEAIICGVYESGDRKLVALWNDSDVSRTPDVSLKGFEIVGWETPYDTGEGRPENIASQDVMVLITREVKE